MIRLFAGLSIPHWIAQDLLDARSGVEGAHWQRDEQLHLTLSFFGTVTRRTSCEICDSLYRVQVRPFDVALRGVGTFGKPGMPRALWAGVENPHPPDGPARKNPSGCVSSGYRAGSQTFYTPCNTCPVPKTQ